MQYMIIYGYIGYMCSPICAYLRHKQLGFLMKFRCLRLGFFSPRVSGTIIFCPNIWIFPDQTWSKQKKSTNLVYTMLHMFTPCQYWNPMSFWFHHVFSCIFQTGTSTSQQGIESPIGIGSWPSGSTATACDPRYPKVSKWYPRMQGTTDGPVQDSLINDD